VFGRRRRALRLSFDWHAFDWSCETYAKTGKMMPADGIQQLRPFDAIFLGAVGHPSVPDHISLWGLLIPIRRKLSPICQSTPGAAVRGHGDATQKLEGGEIDFCVVRENNEGEYSTSAGAFYERHGRRTRRATVGFSPGAASIAWLRFAFELARTRRKHVTSATKFERNYPHHALLDELFEEMGSAYSDVSHDQYHIDILTAHFVRHPDCF